ncbi:RagB/SusD family nutrient uptake outer membrane protein [Neolewinella aurantiaca]|uniref:RagB/SusD family nutrient uptake outer membrane protein n=1 Tax=Neolewinella aurantiaca TaxID=2602767 RepID=A0A5C7FAW9_9BACT|nr:RagB/SusD family nutrient uptake outer membrane protein [Neolewinella aurantiaca]TXF86670.1 RagB/SusD family nutrient uptake outer membrane protein [Neolewinella aurantiaca]
MQFLNRIIPGLLFVAFFTFSCDDDYLEEANPNGVSTDIFWSNLEETESSLTSVYGATLHTYFVALGDGVLRGDMAFPRDRLNPSGRGLDYYYQRFNNGTQTVGFKWDAAYQVIFRANQTIEGLQALEGTVDEERWLTQMAQARFFRGLAHFYLHTTFNEGSIIIRDKVPQSVEDFNKLLAPSSEVIAFVREDLEYAYANLPASYALGNQGRVTAGTAATILGNSYLYSGQFEEAIPYYRDVIENEAYGYELVEDMSLLFTEAGEFNKESIYEINYTLDVQLEDSQWDEESFNNRYGRYTAPKGLGGAGTDDWFPAAWITYEYMHEQLDPLDARNIVSDGTGGTRMRSASLRASAMVALVQDIDTEYYLRPSVPIACPFNRLGFSNWKKYSNHDIAANEADLGGTSWKSGRNVIVNRLAEVYINLAECQIETGDLAGALANLNAVRARWGLVLLGQPDGTNHTFDGIDYNAETLMQHLMFVEKPLELSAEGHATRAIDLRRWGITKQRFEELAELDFHVIDYQYPTEDGDTAKRVRSYLVAGETTNQNAEPAIEEFEIAAQNYLESEHAYLPIPLSEIQNNSSISN